MESRYVNKCKMKENNEKGAGRVLRMGAGNNITAGGGGGVSFSDQNTDPWKSVNVKNKTRVRSGPISSLDSSYCTDPHHHQDPQHC